MIIGGVVITDEMQNKLDYNYKLGIISYLHKSGVINNSQMLALIKLQDDKLHQLDKQEKNQQRREVA